MLILGRDHFPKPTTIINKLTKYTCAYNKTKSNIINITVSQTNKCVSQIVTLSMLIYGYFPHPWHSICHVNVVTDK
jgi:hypothetical protein